VGRTRAAERGAVGKAKLSRDQGVSDDVVERVMGELEETVQDELEKSFFELENAQRGQLEVFSIY